MGINRVEFEFVKERWGEWEGIIFWRLEIDDVIEDVVVGFFGDFIVVWIVLIIIEVDFLLFVEEILLLEVLFGLLCGFDEWELWFFDGCCVKVCLGFGFCFCEVLGLFLWCFCGCG